MARRSMASLLAGFGLVAFSAATAAAQATPTQPATTPLPPLVGDVAPDFTLPGATQSGVTAKPVHLADYRGQVVVLAFFFKARTKG